MYFKIPLIPRRKQLILVTQTSWLILFSDTIAANCENLQWRILIRRPGVAEGYIIPSCTLLTASLPSKILRRNYPILPNVVIAQQQQQQQ